MRNERASVVAVSGSSGSGKTTLIAALLPELVARGLRVVTLKHAHCLAELDRPGKDTWRHRLAGAARVVLEGRGMRAVFEPAPEGRASPHALAARFGADADLVLAEGFRQVAMARIEVLAPGEAPALAPRASRGRPAAQTYYRVVRQPDARDDEGRPLYDRALVASLVEDLLALPTRRSRPRRLRSG